MRKAKRKVVREKHKVFEPIKTEEEVWEEEPKYLAWQMKKELVIKPRVIKRNYKREIPLNLLKRRLGTAIVLYPFIDSFLKSFELRTPVIMTFFNLKYLKKKTTRELARTQGITAPTALKHVTKLIELGLVERFFTAGVQFNDRMYTYQLTLKGLKQINSLESKMVKVLHTVDLKKMDEANFNDEDK